VETTRASLRADSIEEARLLIDDDVVRGAYGGEREGRGGSEGRDGGREAGPNSW
jgi:hypothetical protein